MIETTIMETAYKREIRKEKVTIHQSGGGGNSKRWCWS